MTIFNLTLHCLGCSHVRGNYTASIGFFVFVNQHGATPEKCAIIKVPAIVNGGNGNASLEFKA